MGRVRGRGSVVDGGGDGWEKWVGRKRRWRWEWGWGQVERNWDWGRMHGFQSVASRS